MPTPELNKALAAVQEKLPAVGKNSTVNIPGRPNYEYADLAEVSDAILPLLGKNGLAFTAWPTLDDGKFVLAYTLTHVSGEERAGVYPLPASGKPQDIGSAITYARRYCLCAVTGIAPGGEDNDAAGVPEVHMDRAPRPHRPPSRPTADPVRTATTGADHERLRHGTVEATPDDRRAARGPLPPDDDRWAGQPPGELPRQANGTVGVIQQHFKRLGITDRDVRLGYIIRIVGLKGLASTNDLNEGQAKHVLDVVGKCRDQKALDVLLDRGDAPAEVTT